MNRILRLTVRRLAILTSVLILLLGGLAFYPAFEAKARARPFKAEVWRVSSDTTTDSWPVRLRMVDDLVASQQLLGLTSARVLELLGAPSDIENFRECSRRPDDSEWDIGYKLGPERGPWIRIDSDWLLLDLNTNGRVQRVLVSHD